MTIEIARRLGRALGVTSESSIRVINEAILEYVRLTRQSTVVVDAVTRMQILAFLVWELKTADFTLVSGDKINATAIADPIDATLPAVLVIGDDIILHNASTSTQVVQIEPNGHSIIGAGGTVTSSDTLVLALGDTAHLVAISSSVMEVV